MDYTPYIYIAVMAIVILLALGYADHERRLRERVQNELGLLRKEMGTHIELSLKDELTQLANRRAFDAAVSQEKPRALRFHHDMAALFIDLDNFKVVNDSLGHKVGDELLVSVAGTLRANSRDADVVARYGGDEFALLLPETSLEGACQVARKILAAIAQDISVEGIQVTASIGIASLVETDADRDMIAVADHEMYRAKRSGGDCYADLSGIHHRDG
jgi:diguanylate cyclase (GGDEF)-like protein